MKRISTYSSSFPFTPVKVRVVEYGADKFGFQPSGEGITVAPPTLVDESRNRDADYQDEEERQQQPQRPYVSQREQ